MAASAMYSYRGVTAARRFDRKVVLITGGSSGIGRAAAELFAAEGAHVAVVARRTREGEETVQTIWDNGGTGIFIKADVSQAEDCRAMVEQVEASFGGLDIAFNNAGIGRSGKFVADEDEESWDRVLDVNLKGVFLSMKYELPALLRRGGGAIINTSSVGGLVAAPGMGAYQASKHAVLGLTKVAALEYATRGIRVNAICPGATRSEMLERWFADPAVERRIIDSHPLKRIATPEEVARAAMFLASEESSFITAHALAVDGGVLAQ